MPEGIACRNTRIDLGRTTMIAVVPGSGRWRLVGRTGRGADVLATGRLGETPAGDGPGWQTALERLRDAEGELLVTSPDDRHYRWLLRDSDGVPIAGCPPVFRDAIQCRDAFDTARRAADAALADHYHATGGSDLSRQDSMADATTG
jgi:hypothetical protein